MPSPGAHKTVQARILAYAQAIGWTYVPRGEAEKRREFAPYIESALARKPKMAPLDDAAIPRVEAFGRKAPSPLLNSDRGGAISIPTVDPLTARESARP